MEAVKDSLWGNAEATRRRRWVLLIYSFYSLLMDSDRYKTKFLLPLRDPEGLGHCYEGVGDFALSDEDGRLYECVQVMPYNALSSASVMEAFAKVQPYTPRRFCLLVTPTLIGPKLSREDTQAIQQHSKDIYRAHGCEVITDSLMRTLEYGVRLLAEPSNLLAAYSQALREDTQGYPV